MRKPMFMAAVLCLALAGQACRDSSLFPFDPGDGKKPDPNDTRLTTEQVIGVTWQLKSIETIGGSVVTVPADQLFTLTFEDKQHLSGGADCNGYGAEYAAGSGYSIRISGFIATDAFCGDQSLDQQYMKALNEAKSYEARKETLRIFFDDGKKVLNYVKAGSGQSGGQTDKKLAITDMPGATWKLVAFETVGDATTPPSVAAIIDGEVFTLSVTTDYANHLQGMANCNTYDGQFLVGKNYSFSVYGVGSTEMSCFLNTLEVPYFEALKAAESAVIVSTQSGTSLEIRYDQGRKLLRYVQTAPGPADPQAPLLKDVSGVRWRLKGIGTTGGGMEYPATSDVSRIPTITFDANGAMSGTGYCSRFSGSYSDAVGGSIAISNLNWDAAPSCEFDESSLRKALSTARYYKLSQSDLLIYSDDYMLMVFGRE